MKTFNISSFPNPTNQHFLVSRNHAIAVSHAFTYPNFSSYYRTFVRAYGNFSDDVVADVAISEFKVVLVLAIVVIFVTSSQVGHSGVVAVLFVASASMEAVISIIVFSATTAKTDVADERSM